MPRAARWLSIAFVLSLSAGGPLPAQAPAAADSLVAEWAAQVLATGATPGMALAVVRGDSILLARGFGTADLATGMPVTDATRFYVASTTKALTALAFAVLDRRGALRLDAALATLLPGVRLHEGLDPRAITLRDLLAMRSGIGDGPVVLRTAFTGEFTDSLLLALLAEHPPAEGGRAFRYSNIGFNVAGLALERRRRRPWHEVVRETVLEPLGMSGATARISTVPAHRLAMPHDLVEGRVARIALLKSDRTMHAAGGHVLTADDAARFLLAQLNGGRVRGRRGVPAEAVALTHRPNTPQDRDFSFVHRTGWGIGWDIATYDGMTLLQRNGGFAGYYSHLSFMPDSNVGVAVFANGGLDASASEAVAQGVYDLLLGRRDLAALAPRRDSLVAELARAMARSRARADSARVPLPAPPPRLFGTFRNASLGTLALEGGADALVVRVGDSWSLARGVAGPDGRPLPDALAASVLGGRQRFTLGFAPDGRVREVTVRDFTFRRVE